MTPALTRRSLSALPLAAMTPASNATSTLASDSDAELLKLGRQWEIVCDRAEAQYRSVQGVPDHDPLHQVVDEITDRLFAVQMKLFDAIAATKAQTLRGLAVKAWVLARANECEQRDQARIEEALKGSDELSKSAAFSLVLDILRLAA